MITTKFPNTYTRGFSAVGEPGLAVCLLPGTELAFSEEAEVDYPIAKLWRPLGFGKLGEKIARFRQINRQRQDAHHDALEFANGKVVLLTRLRPDQRVVVLQLPALSQDVHVEITRNWGV